MRFPEKLYFMHHCRIFIYVLFLACLNAQLVVNIELRENYKCLFKEMHRVDYEVHETDISENRWN